MWENSGVQDTLHAQSQRQWPPDTAAAAPTGALGERHVTPVSASPEPTLAVRELLRPRHSVVERHPASTGPDDASSRQLSVPEARSPSVAARHHPHIPPHIGLRSEYQALQLDATWHVPRHDTGTIRAYNEALLQIDLRVHGLYTRHIDPTASLNCFDTPSAFDAVVEVCLAPCHATRSGAMGTALYAECEEVHAFAVQCAHNLALRSREFSIAASSFAKTRGEAPRSISHWLWDEAQKACKKMVQADLQGLRAKGDAAWDELQYFQRLLDEFAVGRDPWNSSKEFMHDAAVSERIRLRPVLKDAHCRLQTAMISVASRAATEAGPAPLPTGAPVARIEPPDSMGPTAHQNTTSPAHDAESPHSHDSPESNSTL